jgi:hypothetical protein
MRSLFSSVSRSLVLHPPTTSGLRPVTDPAGRPDAGGVLFWDLCPVYITRERLCSSSGSRTTTRRSSARIRRG